MVTIFYSIIIITYCIIINYRRRIITVFGIDSIGIINNNIITNCERGTTEFDPTNSIIVNNIIFNKRRINTPRVIVTIDSSISIGFYIIIKN